MIRMRTTAVLVLLAATLGVAAPARAGMRLDAWKGHIGFGYAKVISDSLAPAGSMSFAAGVDYPLSAKWRVGPELSFDLLGSSNVTRGSVVASLDYSQFETSMMAIYLPDHGPISRLSFGPGIASPRSELVLAGGGAGFRDLPVGEVDPELAVDATVMSRHAKFVAVGAEFAGRWIPVSKGSDWLLLTARLAIHF